jgi:hypothetical protein
MHITKKLDSKCALKKGVFDIKFPKRITNSREWAIDEISILVIDDNTAWIDYEKYVVNAERRRLVVRVNWFERRKGITLESKIELKLHELKINLENDNRKIREHKRIENSFSS